MRWAGHVARMGEEYKSFSSSLCNLLHSPVTPSLLGPNILNTMFSNILSFLSSRNVNDQVSHPYKTTGKIIVLYICDQLILIPYYTLTYLCGISYVDNIISTWDASDVKRVAYIDLYIISAFVFTFKVLF